MEKIGRCALLECASDIFAGFEVWAIRAAGKGSELVIAAMRTSTPNNELLLACTDPCAQSIIAELMCGDREHEVIT
jgi:hypothetical protein